MNRLFRSWWRPPLLGDGVIAAAMAVAGIVEALVLNTVTEGALGKPAWLVLTLLVLTVGPMVWRRRFPLWSAGLTMLAIFVTGTPFTAVVCVVMAAYAVTAYGRRPWLVPVGTLYFVGPLGLGTWAALGGEPLPGVVLMGGILGAAVAWGLPFGIGLLVRGSRNRARLRVAELEQDARQAVIEERLRIARELHDVVAHHVSLMGVQAGAARIVLGNRNERATTALSAIEESSRHAVTELHHLLGVLRSNGEKDDPTPQPGLDQVAELVAKTSSAGLTVEGEPRALPRTVDVSAYRVVQEALTNSRKHSGGGTAEVRLRYRPDALEIEVLDNGSRPGPKLKAGIGGHGLIGMRERVAQSGGELHTGPRPTGGFGVHAVFPLDAVVPADGVPA